MNEKREQEEYSYITGNESSAPDLQQPKKPKKQYFKKFYSSRSFGPMAVKIAILAGIFGLVSGGCYRMINPERQAQLATVADSRIKSGGPSDISGVAVSYTHLTLPTICSV